MCVNNMSKRSWQTVPVTTYSSPTVALFFFFFLALMCLFLPINSIQVAVNRVWHVGRHGFPDSPNLELVRGFLPRHC